MTLIIQGSDRDTSPRLLDGIHLDGRHGPWPLLAGFRGDLFVTGQSHIVCCSDAVSVGYEKWWYG